MGKLLEAIKSVVNEGTDLKEIETLIEASTIEGIDTKEKAYDFMLKNSNFNRALDFAIKDSVDNHDKKFMTEKLPGMLNEEREKIRKELNPEETADQKALREMQERINALEGEKKNSLLRDNLRAKAKELGYPEDRAERFSVYGENALKELEADSEFWSGKISSERETATKELYKGNPPPKQSDSHSKSNVSAEEWDAMTPQQKMEYSLVKGNK